MEAPQLILGLSKSSDPIVARTVALIEWVQQSQPTSTDRYVIEERQKWLRVSYRGSAFAFIALHDFTTKALGSVRSGDVMMPQSYQAPAKHARGNVLNDDGGQGAIDTTSPPHVRYLK